MFFQKMHSPPKQSRIFMEALKTTTVHARHKNTNRVPEILKHVRSLHRCMKLNLAAKRGRFFPFSWRCEYYEHVMCSCLPMTFVFPCLFVVLVIFFEFFFWIFFDFFWIFFWFFWFVWSGVFGCLMCAMAVFPRKNDWITFCFHVFVSFWFLDGKQSCVLAQRQQFCSKICLLLYQNNFYCVRKSFWKLPTHKRQMQMCFWTFSTLWNSLCQKPRVWNYRKMACPSSWQVFRVWRVVREDLRVTVA